MEKSEPFSLFKYKTWPRWMEDGLMVIIAIGFLVIVSLVVLSNFAKTSDMPSYVWAMITFNKAERCRINNEYRKDANLSIVNC